MGDEQMGTEDNENLCCISLQALSATLAETVNSPSVLQLQGTIRGQPVNMLVNSGSTTSFINMNLKDLFPDCHLIQKPIRVKVADNRELRCTEEISDCKWLSQGHEFSTNFKFLQLGVFDIILGQDWLYKHSPMYVDWPTKRLKISDNGLPVFLQGMGDKQTVCQEISVDQLVGLSKSDDLEQLFLIRPVTEDCPVDDSQLPPEIQSVISKFQDVFATPTGLPPQRKCDHHIQLIEGAQLVQI